MNLRWLYLAMVPLLGILAGACHQGRRHADAGTLSLRPAFPTVACGDELEMFAVHVDTDGASRDATEDVEWASAAPGVLRVVDDPVRRGRVVGVSVGRAVVRATDPVRGILASATVTVTPARLVSIAVTPVSASIALGTTRQFTATGTYGDNTTQDLTASVTWSSSSGAVATIGNAGGSRGLATSSGTGVTTITATEPGSGVAGSTTLTVTAATLVSIAVTPAAPSVALGATRQFTATGTYTDSSTQDLTTGVTWSSASGVVATISNTGGSQGLATSVGLGSTTITATDPGSSVAGSATLTVTAAALVSIAVTPALPSIALGTTRQFTATGTYTDNTTQDLTTAVTWSSSSGAVATIGNTGGSEGLATSVGTGTTTITATDPGSSIAGSTTLTVTAATLVSIAVTPALPSIALGTTRQFTATGTYTDSSTQDLTTAVTWSSSSGAVATISNAGGSQGLATSAGTGTTTITATDPGTSAAGTATLTVTAATLVSIAVTPALPSIALGTTRQFAATGTYTDNTTQDLTTAVTWSSSSGAVATIGNSGGSQGLATSASTGTTTITATDPGSSIAGSTTLTVTAATLVSIAVTPALPSIALGTTRQFTATGTYTDSSTQDLTTAVTWSSSSGAVATISNAGGSHGLATSASPGSTTITATDPGSSIAGSTTLTVTAATLVSIAVTPALPSIALGTTRQFAATGMYTDSSTQDLTTAVTWSSSSGAVATISNAGGSQGFATSAGTGTTTITATDPGSSIAGSTTLTVTAATLVSIAVTPVLPSIALGTTRQFTATGTYTDSSTQDLTASVTWSSSSGAVATISNAGGSQGLATSASTGTTTITATDPGSSIAGSTTLTVFDDIAFRSAASAGVASGTSLVISAPAGAAENDVLVAGIAIRPQTATVTPPSGWTLVRRLDNSGGAGNSLLVFTRVAGASEPSSYTWTTSSSTGTVGGIAAFRFVDTSAVVDAESGQTTASSLSHAAPSITTATARTMLVTVHAFSSAATWTSPAGMTEVADVASQAIGAVGISMSMHCVVQTSAGATGTKTAVAANDADTGNAAILALRRAP